MKFIKGMDISMVKELEQYGASYRLNGKKEDLFAILKTCGTNNVRIRIWPDPYDENGNSYGGGGNDLETTIEIAERTVQSGMDFMLDFHYSDFWADPAKQVKPKAWKELSGEALETAVYLHTVDTLKALKNHKLVPTMVQVGNEITKGLLWPDGYIEQTENMAHLLQAGIKGVREECPDARIVLHLDFGTDNKMYRQWFDQVSSYALDFDIIGMSYYPHWNGSLSLLLDNMNDISSRYDKDVLVAETSIGYTTETFGCNGIVYSKEHEKITGYPATQQGQEAFLRDLFATVRSVNNKRGIGVFYWEPAWLPIPDCTWASKSGSKYMKDKMTAGNAGEKLVIWTNMNVEVDTIQKYADEWGEKNGRKVEVIHQSPSVQQFAQAVKSASGPDAVVGIPNDQLADYVNADLTAEVPQDLYADQDFSDAAIQACYVDGKRYAAPLSVETTALFYNTDLVSEVPKTWEELVDQAAADGGVQFDATSIYYDLGFVRACGGYIFKYQDGAYDTADIGLDNEGSVEAYAFINDLCNKYKLITADVTADIARSNFQNGKCAYYIGGPWDIDGFTSAGTKFAVAKMPTFHGQPFVTPVGTQVSFVSNSSKNQDAAWDFISYLMENGALGMYEAGDRIPAKLADQKLDEIQSNAYTQAFVEQINDGEPMPTVSEMGQLWSIHTNNIRSMWSGEQTPEEAAKNMVTQLKEAIELMNSGK